MSQNGYLPPGSTHRDVDVHVGAVRIISVECPRCGELNDPAAARCAECGEKLEN